MEGSADRRPPNRREHSIAARARNRRARAFAWRYSEAPPAEGTSTTRFSTDSESEVHRAIMNALYSR